jgi:glutamate-1-semialdehyde 2,1-aminomutase
MAGNALSLAAMRATLRHVLTREAYANMAALGGQLADGIRRVIGAHSLPWHVAQLGGRVEFHFCPHPLRNGADGARVINRALSQYLQLYALNRGVMMFPFHNRALVCPAHSGGDIELFLSVLDEAVQSLKGASGHHDPARGARA